MTTFHEVLEATKSSKHRGIRWQPDFGYPAGRLEIDTDRATVAYVVSEFGTPWDGRAFRFEKAAPGTDPDADSYDVFIHRGGQDHRCCCKGFEQHGNCKHISAALALIENQWI